jgi:non-specific serine/threonine protein kinase
MSLENTAAEVQDEEFVDELKPGTKLMLGQYTIEDFLAAGGFGITYLAKDSLDRRVVIKECFPGSFCRRQNTSVTPRSRAHQNELRSIVRLFSQEAMALAKANHPNIVGVHQVFEENNTAYMALDYVHGRDLLEILQEDPDSLKPDLVEGYLKKILDAIKHVHQLGMLHRDISPDNIIINDQGEPILIDFGAARESTNERVTRMLSALRVVKDGYSPQEFYIAGSEQTPSCDLYSLAASFYHIITRELPPDSQWRLSSCAAGDDDPYVSLGEKTNHYSKRFVTGLDKAMSILPRDRMQDAEEWLAHMSEAAPVTPKKPERRDQAAPAAAEKKSIMPILLGTSALAAAAGVGFFMMSNSEADAPTGAIGADEALASVEAPAATPAPVAETVEEIVAEAAPEPVDEAPAPVVAETPVFTAPAAEEDFAAAAPSEDPESQIGAAVAPTEDAAPEIAEIAEPAPAVAPPAPVETQPEPEAVVEVPAVPDLPEVEAVTVAVAEPLAPATDEIADLEVPSSVSPLPETVVRPQPRPLRELEVAMAALADASPVIVTEAPAAPEPAPVDVVEVEEVAPAPAVDAIEPAPVETAVAETAPVETAEAETPVPADAAEPAPSTLDFFVSMAKSQPELTTSRTARTAVRAPAPVIAPSTTAPASNAISPIVARYVPVLPFTLSPWQPGLVISVEEGAPEWLARNSRIVSVNGTAVSSNNEIAALVKSTPVVEGETWARVQLGIDAGLNTAVVERTLTVETEKQTLLLNGLRFVTRKDGAGWKTEVIEAPGSSSFKVGDTLVAFASTMESLDGPNSLQNVLERELASGKSSFSFAVKRNGEIWVEAFNLASLAN